MNKYFIIKIVFPIGILLTLLFNSCIKDSIQEIANINGVEVNPTLSVPLLNDKFGVKDIYSSYSSQAYIVVGSDKFITFVYSSDFNISPKQFVAIPPISVNYNVGMDQGSIAQFNAIGSFSNSFSNYAVVKTNNKERLKKINVRTGNFNVRVSSDFKHNAIVVFNYPSITKNGVPLVDTFALIYTGVSPIIIDKVLDLSGYDVDLSDKGISYNVIPYLIDIDIKRNPQNSVSVNDRLNISETLNIQEYNFIQGYLGKFNILSYATSSRIDLFEKNDDGNIYIKDPRVRVTIQNGIGIPITAKVSNMSITAGKGNIYPVTIDQFKDTFTLVYPTIDLQGQIIQSQYIIDKTNSNIDSVFSHAPQNVYYELNFTANYNENADEDNFIIADNAFNSNATTELPLEIKLLSFQLRNLDTLVWPTIPDNIVLDWIKITGSFVNSFPIANTFQLYFVKDSTILGLDSFVVVDSLYSHQAFMPGAEVDVNGKILKPAISTNEFILDQTKYNALVKKANKTLFISNVKTSDLTAVSPFVKLFSDQELAFKIGVEMKGKFQQSVKSKKP